MAVPGERGGVQERATAMTGCRGVAVQVVATALRACVVGVACLVGVAAGAVPVAAAVTVTRSAGVRGGTARLVFRVTDERAAAHTVQVDLYLPDDAPVAEVYPLTVPDWTPKVATRKLDRPVEAIHGTPLTEV